MKLTTFSDYSLRVLMLLATDRERLFTIAEAARAYDISEGHLMKVVHRLAQAGMIESVRGKGGGIRLARAPAEINLATVVRASEGDAPIVECLRDARACRITPACGLAGVLVEAFDALYASLGRYTLADIVRDPARLGGMLLPRIPVRAPSTRAVLAPQGRSGRNRSGERSPE